MIELESVSLTKEQRLIQEFSLLNLKNPFIFCICSLALRLTLRGSKFLLKKQCDDISIDAFFPYSDTDEAINGVGVLIIFKILN